MLTGTLVTVSGFLPIALAKSSTGEYTRSIFEVSAIALIVSWFAAVVLVPLLGYHMLPEQAHRDGHAHGDEVYDTGFYRRLSGWISACIERRWVVLGVTAVLFAIAMAAFTRVPQQFSRIRSGPNCSSTCACRKAPRSRPPCARQNGSKRRSTVDPKSTTWSISSAPARRVSICPSTSSFSSRTSRSS